jgi:biotin transport system substrate-specific component
VSSTTHPAAQPYVLGDVLPGERVRDVLLTVGFTLAIAASAQLYFFLPGNPVPITAETFVVLAGAIVLGRTRATLGAMGFLALGAAGVPAFAASSGATLGYIIGFVAAAALLGTLARAGYARSVGQVTVAMVLGNLVIYALGTVWLAIVTGMDASTAMATGIVPFLLGDAVKIAAAVALVPTLWKLVDRRG